MYRLATEGRKPLAHTGSMLSDIRDFSHASQSHSHSMVALYVLVAWRLEYGPWCTETVRSKGFGDR